MSVTSLETLCMTTLHAQVFFFVKNALDSQQRRTKSDMSKRHWTYRDLTQVVSLECCHISFL